MTMMSSFGGGTTSLIYSLIKLKGRIDAIDIINGILGSLVAVTAGCFLYRGQYCIVDDNLSIFANFVAWEALVVGCVGALLACGFMPLFDLVRKTKEVCSKQFVIVFQMGIDDPVGASAVHGVGGIWGVIAVGIFAENPYPLLTTTVETA
jgi:Amt family ammonium transporter